MTEFNRTHYLLTGLAVVKEHVLINQQHVGQSSRREYSYNLQRRANFKDHKRQEICVLHGWKLYFTKNSAETRRKAVPTVTINCQFYATTALCNSYIYHHHVLTCNMSTLCNNCNKQFEHLPSSCANLWHAKYASGKVFTIQLSCINQ